MKILTTPLEGVFVIEPQVFEDHRGFFMETYHQSRYQESGFHRIFVQDNLSFSARGTLRGLHYQIRKPQAKLVQVVTGEIFDVTVDIRPNSPTFSKWTGILLSEQNRRQVFIPEGFAHGFCVLSNTAHFLYKCSDFFNPYDEGGIVWSDPTIGIEWPIKDPVLSEKDKQLPQLSEILPRQLPK
jgi:dTDP-4-dehydrorhamnose 3,5-epimerase